MKYLIPIVLLIALWIPAPSGAQSWRYPVTIDGGVALMDETGAVISERRFEAGRAFPAPDQNALGAVSSEGLWGYVDRDAEWVIEPRFLEADVFEGNRARVRLREGWILINREGEQVTKRAYPGLKAVEDGVTAYQAGRAVEEPGVEGQWGLLGSDGGGVPPAVFPEAAAFSEGRIALQEFRKLLFLKLERQWGFADSTGAWVVEPTYTSVRGYSDGLALVSDGSGTARYIDRDGNEVLSTTFPIAGSFSEGHALVAEDGLWGFMDRRGEVSVPLRYDAVKEFSGGLAAVTRAGVWGYVDTRGQEVIVPQFRVARSFEGPLARVVGDNGPQYIDSRGRPVGPQ